MSTLSEVNGRYVRPTPFEIAVGWMPGLLPPTSLPHEPRTPRQALEDAVRPALERGPCYVTFSGGRDSSAVLAVATDVARREGLPLPVPVTRRYPGVAESDESRWQELVVRHLALPEWICIPRGDDDLLGGTARAGLRRRGLLWPPALQVQETVYEALGDGGSVLTGEGGDETLGPRRVTPVTLLLRLHRRPARALLGWALESVAPGPARRATIRKQLENDPHRPRWLRPPALAELNAAVASDLAAEPVRYDAATWWTTRKRFWAVLGANQRAVAAEYGLDSSDPLLDRGFLAALARLGGPWGFAGRTALMKRLFGDLLPPELLARGSKARFNRIYSGEGTREFARAWDGAGVDRDLVAPEALRRAWLAERPTSATAMLLHAAWLASTAEEHR